MFVKRTQNGAVTDLDGKYQLTRVNTSDVLVFSCIGYAPQEITWTGGELNVILEEDATLLEETVVVGYGVQKKMNLSGAVSSVKMEEVLGDRPQPNVAAALQGAIPGLYISSTSNTPGQTGKSIQIRGSSSFEDVRRWKKADWFVNKQHYGAWVNADNTGAVISKTGGATGLLNASTRLEASAADVAAQGGGHLYYYLDPVKAGKGWLDKYYLEPIPSEELLLNSALEQQTGWK